MKIKTFYKKLKYNKNMKYIIKKEIIRNMIFEAGRYIIDNDERFKGTECHHRTELLKQVRQEGRLLFITSSLASKDLFNKLSYKFRQKTNTLDDAKLLLVVGEYLFKTEIFGDYETIVLQ